MAIKVKLQDGKIQVGGNFNAALAYVKGKDGRRYDVAAKTWTVPATVESFMRNCSLPTEILEGDGSARYGDGNHVTKWGNVYSGEEWDAQKDVWAAEKRIGGDHASQYEASRKRFQADLAALGMSGAAARMLESHIWDCEDAEGYRLKFSSQARRDEVFAVVEARRGRDCAIGEAEDAVTDAERERIFSAVGVL